ncbi:hypothetical protein FLONG3_2215 [Fusarium longipes]|uniref:Uncharacterized protein n=1 Tax=Fusarium longipes TaxID=694270 RepID=A0A395T4R7_9HYPO|nr:hypothetical protein FLONG3_2215 [Fusarium longipes]
MFLVEGDGKAILYTGDIRSEPWFVNAISRNPILVEYTSGLNILDKIYLDTSFTEDVPFQTKAQGIAELLKKVSQYPKDTVFHLQAWTYGYEDVWIALSKALNSKIHVDNYKMEIYGSLKLRPRKSQFDADIHLTHESPALTGHMCGNTPHPGCLTSNVNPIIAHLPTGDDLAELGVGGGGDDLKQDVELELLDQDSLATFLTRTLSSSAASTHMPDMLQEGLEHLFSTGRNIPLDWKFDGLSEHSAEEVVALLIKRLGMDMKNQKSAHEEALPKMIYFPYSRHSSLPELCHLVEAFRPKEVWPCTVNTAQWLKNGTSVGSLFGRFCSGEDFEHDRIIQALADKNAINRQHASQTTLNSDPVPSSPVHESQGSKEQRLNHFEPKFVSLLLDTQTSNRQEESNMSNIPIQSSMVLQTSDTPVVSSEDVIQDLNTASEESIGNASDNRTHVSSVRKRTLSEASQNVYEHVWKEDYSLARRNAYWQTIRNLESDTSWTPLQLISTSDEYTLQEKEL